MHGFVEAGKVALEGAMVVALAGVLVDLWLPDYSPNAVERVAAVAVVSVLIWWLWRSF